MSANPEQGVLDAIDELVQWQMDEGVRRGEYCPPSVGEARIRLVADTGDCLALLEAVEAVSALMDVLSDSLELGR